MQYLQKLPMLLALAASLFTGLAGFIRQTPQKEILLQMVLVMTLFFVIGLFVKSTLLNAIDQVKKEQEDAEREEQKKKQASEQEKNDNKAEAKGQNVDFTVGNVDEDAFDPLPVSEFIKKELKQDKD